MKTKYKNLIIDFDRECVEDSPIKWYGSTWVNNECLVCCGGETIHQLCENLHYEVSYFYLEKP